MSITKSDEFRALTAQDIILRQIFDHEKICFKQCLTQPAKILSSEEERCLKNCTSKLMKGIEYLGKAGSRKDILGSEPSS